MPLNSITNPVLTYPFKREAMQSRDRIFSWKLRKWWGCSMLIERNFSSWTNNNAIFWDWCLLQGKWLHRLAGWSCNVDHPKLVGNFAFLQPAMLRPSTRLAECCYESEPKSPELGLFFSRYPTLRDAQLCFFQTTQTKSWAGSRSTSFRKNEWPRNKLSLNFHCCTFITGLSTITFRLMWCH